VSPRDCVRGRTQEEAQACHWENLNALVSGHFSAFSPASVTRDDFEDASKIIELAGLAEGDKSCCIMQVINNSVWVVGGCGDGMKHRVFGALLEHAVSLPDIGLIPDVEMHICEHDFAPLILPSNGVRAPILASVSLPEARGQVIPVPMLHRRSDSLSEGYADICFGQEVFESTNYSRTLAGERQCLPYSATSWANKTPAAFFRGGIYEDSEKDCICHTEDNQFFDCAQVCTRDHLGLPCARPRARTQCSRIDLLAALQGREGFDVTSTDYYVDECLWELNQFLLVMGNSLGWADRVQESLFKTSPTILVDSGAYEWFYPLMIENVHYIRADTTVSSVLHTVEAALKRGEVDATRLTQQANAFAQLVFGLDNAARYAALVAKAYSRVQAYKPQKRSAADGVSVRRPCDGYSEHKEADKKAQGSYQQYLAWTGKKQRR